MIFDIAGPLVAYQLLRSYGMSSGMALVLSGVLPGIAVLGGLIRGPASDAVGALVLAGIAVGTVVRLVSGNARLVLIEGSVPTGVFGVLCLASLWSRRPLIYRFALEFIGAGHPARSRVRQPVGGTTGFRHVFRLFTVVWGVTYLAEAAARVVIVETTSTGTALAVSKVMPYAVGGLLACWMIIYGRHARREGERLAAAAEAAAAQANAPVDGSVGSPRPRGRDDGARCPVPRRRPARPGSQLP